MRPKVVAFGEMMKLSVHRGPQSAHKEISSGSAGAEHNVLIALSRLGERVGMMSAVGDDRAGRYVVERLRRAEVDTTRVRVDSNHKTGLVFKAAALDGGDPVVQYFRQGSAASQMSVAADFDKAYLRLVDVLHTTGIFLALSAKTLALQEWAMQYMRTQGRIVSFDPNLRPALWGSEEKMITTINQLAMMATWLLPGIGEGRILTGEERPWDIAEFYLQKSRQVKIVVIKLGAEGAYFLTHKGEEGYVPGTRVRRVVDTVGAGDAFAAGFLSGMLEKIPVAEAVARGNRAAAAVIQVKGDCLGPLTKTQRRAILYGPSS